MEDVKGTIDSFSNTNEISNTLLAIAYWLGVVVIILFVVYIIYAISHHLRNKRFGIKDDNDDFLDD